MDVILKRLNELEQLIKNAVFQKEVLTFSEACAYCGFSHSYMYQLTAYRKIPYYKTNHKRIFFRRMDLDGWLLHNRAVMQDEVQINVRIKVGE
jgi:excisionase family DNA binding protein